jgi:histidinol dehydrogenase
LKLLVSDDVEELLRELNGQRAFLSLDQTYLDVVRIVEDVKANGDSALKRYSLKFDGQGADKLSLGLERLRELAGRADGGFAKAFQRALSGTRDFNDKVLALLGRQVSYTVQGLEIEIKFEPLRRIGVYVPKGRSTYVSTLVMAAFPARLSGVERIEVCTPPAELRSLSNFAYACENLGVREVYLVGGAHAIAALAYGTETVKRVEKIVGPGGIYVTMAKHYVSKDVAIDFMAGPTELLILADDSADGRMVALDMLSQAEHGPDSWVGLITDSEAFGRTVVKEVESLERDNGLATDSLGRRCWIAVVSKAERAAELADRLAPEHVELVGSKFETLASRIGRAGVVSVGEEVPASATDYFLGPDHILPTLGMAASRGCLSPLDFLKMRVEVRGCGRLPDDLLSAMLTFAREEGFEYHAKSLEARMRRQG